MSKYPDWEPLPQHPALRLVFVDQPPNNAITISSFQVNNRINSGSSNVTRTIFSLKSTIDLKKWENTAFTSKGQERGIKLCHKWPCPSALHKSARKESRKSILVQFELELFETGVERWRILKRQVMLRFSRCCLTLSALSSIAFSAKYWHYCCSYCNCYVGASEIYCFSHNFIDKFMSSNFAIPMSVRCICD